MAMRMRGMIPTGLRPAGVTATDVPAACADGMYHPPMDLAAALVGLAWNAGVLAVLARVRERSGLLLVLGFALVSLYTADRILPRVLVDAWPNFDAARTPALRPILTWPDLLLIGYLAFRVRSVSGRALVMVGALLLTALVGAAVGLTDPRIPPTAVWFWAIVPLRGAAVVLAVDDAIRRAGWDAAARAAGWVLAAAAAVLGLQLIAVTLAKAVADVAGVDLARVWSGFDWVRPNLPGWNNNTAASAVSLGAAGALLLPSRLRPSWPVQATVVTIAAGALVAAEYRTAILVLVLAIGLRLAIEVHARQRRSWGPARSVATAAVVAALAAAIALTAFSLAVPRFADLNPVRYAAIVLGMTTPADGGEPDLGDPGVEPADSSTASRAQLIQASLTVWSRGPLVGPGLGAWEFTRPIEPTFLQKAITPHNGYAWVLADLGILGVVAFYLLPVALVVLARPPLPLAALVGLAFLLEVSIVGVAHSRHAVLLWGIVALVALRPRNGMTEAGPERRAR
jgi:hypothetical protein